MKVYGFLIQLEEFTIFPIFHDRADNELNVIVQKDDGQRMGLPLHRHQVANLSNKIDGLDSFLEIFSVSNSRSEDFDILFFILDFFYDLVV